MRVSSALALMPLSTLLAGVALLALAGGYTSLIEGRVFDEDGPVAGARVRLKGTSTNTRTDGGGRFHLPKPADGRRVTAWKPGYLIGGSRLAEPLSIRLKPLPAEDDPEYEWIEPSPDPTEVHNCANCHAEIYREWSASGHAHSVDGRHFRNLYEGTDWHGKPDVGWGLLTQHPDGAGVCTSCHAPTAPSFISPQIGRGIEGGERKVRGVAARGVHCDYCHKIADVAGGPIGLSHGRFNLRLLRPSLGQLFFGALDDVDRGEDVYSPLYRDSRYCASCHEGVIFGVHVYSTFSEWQASPAARQGQQCQDCHMKPTGRMTNMAPGHGGIDRDPRTLSNHRFFDGSQEAMLRRAVRTSADFERGDDGIRARVRVWAEGVGHRLPTGFVDRHLVLTVEGQDAAGHPLTPRSGPKLPSPAGPKLAGQPGRLYARLLRDFDGHGPVPFWLASPDPPPDTRLTPGEVETLSFEFPPTLARLRLRVLYRRFWPEVARSKHWPDRALLVLEREFSTLP